jgi:hypothetical protein
MNGLFMRFKGHWDLAAKLYRNKMSERGPYSFEIGLNARRLFPLRWSLLDQ